MLIRGETGRMRAIRIDGRIEQTIRDRDCHRRQRVPITGAQQKTVRKSPCRDRPLQHVNRWSTDEGGGPGYGISGHARLYDCSEKKLRETRKTKAECGE